MEKLDIFSIKKGNFISILETNKRNPSLAKETMEKDEEQ